jgi:aldehyde:ferredoxin oxidoreductase
MYYEMYQLWKRVKNVPKIGLFSMIYHKDRKYEADEAKAAIGAACSKYMGLLNGAGACMFGAFMGAPRFPIFEWFNAATGWNKTPEEYMEIGARIQTLRQAFNVKQGIKPKEVKTGPRALGLPPQKEGANKGRTVDLETMMSDYWREFGWDPQTGEPKNSSLDRLDIEDSKKDL